MTWEVLRLESEIQGWGWVSGFLREMVRPTLALVVVIKMSGDAFAHGGAGSGRGDDRLKSLGGAGNWLSLGSSCRSYSTRTMSPRPSSPTSLHGYTAGRWAKHVPCGKVMAGAAILSGTSITMLRVVLLNVFPFTPRYIIPVVGIMVGNSMTVTMKRLGEDIKIQSCLVETALALGESPRQVKRALVIALSPVLDHAKTGGMISHTGVMTGFIMGGASPAEAIQQQIVVMNMLIGMATVSSITSTYL